MSFLIGSSGLVLPVKSETRTYFRFLVQFICIASYDITQKRIMNYQGASVLSHLRKSDKMLQSSGRSQELPYGTCTRRAMHLDPNAHASKVCSGLK